jgi:hypothetical protein
MGSEIRSWHIACCTTRVRCGWLFTAQGFSRLLRWIACALATHCALTLASPALADARSELADPNVPRGGGRTSLGRALDAPDEAAIETSREENPDWGFDVNAITSVPLSIGVGLNVTTPIGITAHLEGGHAPNAYLDLARSALFDAGVYGAHVDPLVREAIANGAWNVRVGLGYTVPEGFEIAAGYTYLGASADLGSAAIESATGQQIPGMTVVPIRLNLHAFHARIGWRFTIEEHWVVRAALGWTHSFGSEVVFEVPPEYDPKGGPADRMEQLVEDGLGRYGFTPEIVIGAGYRF